MGVRFHRFTDRANRPSPTSRNERKTSAELCRISFGLGDAPVAIFHDILKAKESYMLPSRFKRCANLVVAGLDIPGALASRPSRPSPGRDRRGWD